MYQKQLEEYFAAHRDEMIEDICTLIRIPSDRQEAKRRNAFWRGSGQSFGGGDGNWLPYGAERYRL